MTPLPERTHMTSPLHVVDAPEAGVDLAAAERAALDLLTALGADLELESLRETPGRMGRPYPERPEAPGVPGADLPNGRGFHELVVARAIPFHSLCEHHLL